MDQKYFYALMLHDILFCVMNAGKHREINKNPVSRQTLLYIIFRRMYCNIYGNTL